jgi:hypothetical protein
MDISKTLVATILLSVIAVIVIVLIGWRIIKLGLI